MKKILVSMFLLVFGLCLAGCVDTPNGPGTQDPFLNDAHKLTVIDDFGYLVKPLDKYYKAGEEVEVHLAFLSGPSVGININGEYIGENAETKHVDGHPVITFIMPDKDSILYTTMNGYILKDCGEDNHQWDEGREIAGGNGGYVMKYFCELCGKFKEETITIIPSENEILSDFLTMVNPNIVYLSSHIDNFEKIISYHDFKKQLFFSVFSQIKLTKLDDKVDYEVAQADYYINLSNTLNNEFVILEFFSDIDNHNDDYFYGWLKTSNSNGVYEFKIEKSLFSGIYNYFNLDIITYDYYARENNNYIDISNYCAQKIINTILEAEEITYTQSEFEKLDFDLLITTYNPESGLDIFNVTKYQYEIRLDYETGIAEFATLIPVISSSFVPNKYFKLTIEEFNEIKELLTKQPYELINDIELLSFYSETMVINSVEGFPYIITTDDLHTSQQLTRVHERYNEEFFNEYALMIIKFETNSIEKIIGLDDIEFDGNKFTAIFDITPVLPMIMQLNILFLK